LSDFLVDEYVDLEPSAIDAFELRTTEE
jgi:hypothetical protein